MRTPFLACVLLMSVNLLRAATIHVPGDQPTIQDAINIANTGDVVLVAPGTYSENINFVGKAITVASSNGTSVTIIDGGKAAPVVGFAAGETSKSVLRGFTLQNGSSTFNTQYDGGGIYISGASPAIVGNVIRNNTACNAGGGMWIVNDSNALIVQNLFYANTASQGGAIYLSMPSGSTGPVLVNNTIIGGNGATQGSAVWAGGFDSQVFFYNNLLIGLSTQNAVYCDATYSSVPPVFTNNDAYSPAGSGLEGTCASEQGQSGNISANPLFVNASKKNFQLQSTSPAINAGDNSAPNIPPKDLAGKTRIVGGVIDLGAYEFQ